MIKGELNEERVVIWDLEEGKNIFENGWYGKLKEDGLELSLVEAVYLVQKKKISVKKTAFKKLFDHAMKIDKRFNIRYTVYKDLRERGLPVRTGFKFGCDFRVYERGVKPIKRGPKSAKEHTKWVVFAVPEDHTCSFQELSRAVRLAHNIRANMLWGIVDNDGDCTYYEIKFISP